MRMIPFLGYLLVAHVAGFEPQAALQDRNPKGMTIVGYADRLTVQPGETIQFMVSTLHDRYRADIVRLIHGDPNPAGPGIKEEKVDSPVTGEYPGQFQPLPNGSYATVPDHPSLRPTGSFTLQAWIYATTPRKGKQGLLTKGTALTGVGYGLELDEQGRLAFWLGNGRKTTKFVHTEAPLAAAYERTERPSSTITNRPRRSTIWHFVAAVFDASDGTVALYQEPLSRWPFQQSRSVVMKNTGVHSIVHDEAPFMIAASSVRSKDDHTTVGAFFNGKIDSPRLFNRALSKAEIRALQQGAGPRDAAAAWDFATDISSRRIVDTSPNKLHGRTINMPTRAVTGHNWNGTETDFQQAPEQYGAIHFHDDDLNDANWEAGFSLTIPEGMRSGVYAAQLRSGDGEDYVPFFVRPKTGMPTASTALLIPTFSYLAYANSFDDETPNLRGIYDHHSDGSGVAYSSRLRPILDMRPKIATNNPWEFVADLHLTDWLEAKRFPYDVITDDAVHKEGVELLSPYRIVMTGTHPEYYSTEMLDAVQSYLEGGGRLMYMGGNGFYWVTTMDSQQSGTIEVRRWGGTQYWEAMPGEYHHSMTGELGGLWRFRGRAPQKLVGVGFTAQGFDRNAPYRRQPQSFDPRSAFIFDGIGTDELIGNFPSLVLSFGAAGSELDRLDHALGTPPHALILATASGQFSDAYQHVVEEVQASNEGPWDKLVRADMVYFEYPNGGAVWTPGSIAWGGSLSYNDYNNNVSRITENVLRRFASDQPLPGSTIGH